jgi:hypothetical protein
MVAFAVLARGDLIVMQYTANVERYSMKIAPFHTKRQHVEGNVHSFAEISVALLVQVTISESLAEVEVG